MANAVDQVDLSAVALLGVYETDLEVHPMIARVIVRADATKDPYAGLTQGQRLKAVTSEWNTNQSDAVVDDVAVLTNRDGGAGIAYLSTAGNPGHADAGGTGNLSIVVQRHEFGHTWSALDNHTNGPEGATINSGNGFDRWDGTELRSMLNYRNANLSKFTDLGTFSAALPPYASLDLVDHLMSTVPFTMNPIANDHDANGHALVLESVSATSSLGGKVTSSGNAVTYTPPAVTAAQTVDWVQYVVKDTVSGKTATGVIEFRVDPYATPPASSTWPTKTPASATAYQLSNRQSGLVAAAPAGVTANVTLVQRAGTDLGAQWAITPRGSGVQLKNRSDGLCMDLRGNVSTVGADVMQYPCHGHTNQQWKVVQNPAGDHSLISVRSGLCLVVRAASILSGAKLMQARCGLQAAGIWSIGLAPMSTWDAATLPTTGNQELVNAGTRFHVGTPPGTGLSATFVQQAPSADTALTFVANSDGTWQVRQTSSGSCFNDRAGEHADIVTWYCSASAGDAFRFVADPLGGVLIVGVSANECVGIDGASPAAGTKLQFEPCDTTDETQRWTIAAPAA